VIKCGQDGSSANNCTLKDGFIMLAALKDLPGLNVTNNTINGLKIQGLTFTGVMKGLPTGPPPAPTLPSNGFLADSPGKGIVIKDCHWKNLTVEGNVIQIGRSSTTMGLLANKSIDVTVTDCTFTDLAYTRANQSLLSRSIISAIAAGNQSFTVKRSSFKRVNYVGPGPASLGNLTKVTTFLCDGCNTTCKISKSCFNDLKIGNFLFFQNCSPLNITGGGIKTSQLYLKRRPGITVNALFTTDTCKAGLAVNAIPGNNISADTCTNPFKAKKCKRRR
jgi:hypothetical protein